MRNALTGKTFLSPTSGASLRRGFAFQGLTPLATPCCPYGTLTTPKFGDDEKHSQPLRVMQPARDYSVDSRIEVAPAESVFILRPSYFVLRTSSRGRGRSKRACISEVIQFNRFIREFRLASSLGRSTGQGHSSGAATGHVHSPRAATSHVHSTRAATSHVHSPRAVTSHVHSPRAATSHVHSPGGTTGCSQGRQPLDWRANRHVSPCKGRQEFEAERKSFQPMCSSSKT